MAGDWIKFECATSEKPEIWAMAEELGIDPDAVVGKMLRVWAWFDQHTQEGNAPSVTKSLLDRCVGVTGFCKAVIKVGWMLDDGETLSLPNFDLHNGKTAKTRAQGAKRAASHKNKHKSNAESNGDSVTTSLPKEEKKREDIKDKKTIAAADAGASTTAPAVITNKIGFNYELGQWTGLTADSPIIATWQDAYPAIDMRYEFNAMRAWLMSNRKNKKTNLERFINTWLAKEQDKAVKPQSQTFYDRTREAKERDADKRLTALSNATQDELKQLGLA